MANSYNTLANETFSAFTGADLNAIVTYQWGGQQRQVLIGSLTSLTFSIVREVNPIWTMGSPDYRAVARGKRSVSGTLTFAVLDRDPLVRDIFDLSQYLPMNNTAGLSVNALTPQSGMLSDGTSIQGSLAAAANVATMVLKTTQRYADQLPPFDVTVSMTNELGASSTAAVRQITIVSSGGGWNIHDLEADQIYSFIARYYEPLTSLTDKAAGNGAAIGAGQSSSVLANGSNAFG